MAAKKKKRKIRVAFRKNRQKRSRENDLTRDIREGIDAAADVTSRERFTGKGDLTRRRTIVIEEQGDEVLRDIDKSRCLRGRVLESVGLHSFVRGDDGVLYECTVRRVLRTMARDSRNVVVAGDEVLFLPTGRDDEKGKELGVIEWVAARHGTISRTSHRREHVLVANIDQVLIVVSAAEPKLKPNLVDRFLISAGRGGVQAIVCINKCDLIDPAALQPIAGIYGQLGYEVVLTSAATGTGVSRVKRLLANRQTVVSGQSGVGKSSLLNAIQPELGLRVGQVSLDSGKGRHTTRTARLIELDFGGWVVDTPGVRQFELWDVAPGEVEGYFYEFHPFVALCRFPDCLHTHEDGCGVKQAVRDELISPLRYASYVRILTSDDSA